MPPHQAPDPDQPPGPDCDPDSRSPSPEHPSFVLHEHRKPRHHFDLRLEEDGVLRSWAVPRGLPESSRGNRLAVQVPDHELEHLTYEDADKSIADIGWWEENDRNDRRFVFTLHGRGAPRRYALIRTDSDWLLHLTKDQPPSPSPCPAPDRPVSPAQRSHHPPSGHGGR